MAISPVSGLQAAQLIVSPTPGFGNYTTIQAAINAASSGQTILIKPGTYTENLTLKAGVNLTAFTGDSNTPNVNIVGKATFTAAGLCSISNIRLQTNSDFLLEVSGSAASIVYLENCYLNCTNNTGISFTSSSASSVISINNSTANLATTGIAYFAKSGAGFMSIFGCQFLNPGSSVTSSTTSAGLVNAEQSTFDAPITTSGTASLGLRSNDHHMSASTACVVAGGSGAHEFLECNFNSITGTALTFNNTNVSSLENCTIFSAGSVAITGTGNVFIANLSFDINATVSCGIQKRLERHGVMLSSVQPAFFTFLGSTANNTVGDGSGTTYVLGTDALTEIYDNNGDMTTGGLFTAPYTGVYMFVCNVVVEGCTIATSINLTMTTTTQSYMTNNGRPASSENLSANLTVQAFMNAGDTASWSVYVSGEAAATDDVFGSAVTPATYISGWLMG